MQVTFADCLLSYRQAKNEFRSSRVGFGETLFAEYEDALHKNLESLKQHGNGDWFKGAPCGAPFIRPKKSAGDDPPNTIYVGPPKPRTLDIRFHMTPDADFHTLEVLYLRRYGQIFEAMLRPEVLGDRLKDVSKW